MRRIGARVRPVNQDHPRQHHRILIVLLALWMPGVGCSIRKLAVNRIGDALSEGGSTFASDDDPELIEAALPFSLKLMESLLAQSPRHEGLLRALTSGFTQYAYAFVQQDAERLEDRDLAAATVQRRECIGFMKVGSSAGPQRVRPSRRGRTFPVGSPTESESIVSRSSGSGPGEEADSWAPRSELARPARPTAARRGGVRAPARSESERSSSS